MKNEDFLLELIKMKSDSGNEKAIGEYIYNKLKKRGFQVKKQPVNIRKGNFNVYAYLGKPKVLFSNHIDTVPVELEIKKDNNKIFGRGACDNKSQVAAAIIAAETALDNGLTDFGLIFTVQEESDFSGAKKIVDFIPKCELIVIGEPTNLKIVKGHNGILVFKLIAKGKGAHSATPEKGINAIEVLIDDLNKLRIADLGINETLGKNILNIARISGGCADNIVPDRATATVSYRTAGDSKILIKKIKSLVKSRIEIVADFEPVANDIDGSLVKTIKREVGTARYFTEASILKPKADNIIIIGAGNIKEAHGPNEFVLISEFNKLVDIFTNIIKHYN